MKIHSVLLLITTGLVGLGAHATIQWFQNSVMTAPDAGDSFRVQNSVVPVATSLLRRPVFSTVETGMAGSSTSPDQVNLNLSSSNQPHGSPPMVNHLPSFSSARTASPPAWDASQISDVSLAEVVPHLVELDSPAPGLSKTEIVSGVTPPANGAPPPQVQWPLVMKEVAPAITPLKQEQRAVVERTQEEFIQLIGGEDQPANAPGYQDKWLQAQPIADQRLRARLGEQAFREYELATVRTETAARMAAMTATENR